MEQKLKELGQAISTMEHSKSKKTAVVDHDRLPPVKRYKFGTLPTAESNVHENEELEELFEECESVASLLDLDAARHTNIIFIKNRPPIRHLRDLCQPSPMDDKITFPAFKLRTFTVNGHVIASGLTDTSLFVRFCTELKERLETSRLRPDDIVDINSHLCKERVVNAFQSLFVSSKQHSQDDEERYVHILKREIASIANQSIAKRFKSEGESSSNDGK